MEKVRKVVRHGLEMREYFNFHKFKMDSWYPRHMNSGYLQLQSKLHSVDCLIEVHDARIPYSGRNDRLSDLGIIKPSVLVMNKMDLIDHSYIYAIRQKLEEEGRQVLFTNCKVSNNKGVKLLVPKILKAIKNSDRFNRSARPEFQVMVIGIPNVGKSSIINAMRNFNLKMKKASVVGPTPGVTRSVLMKIRVNSNPAIYVLDTPGILNPYVDKAATAFKLGLTATVRQNRVPEDFLADYLLYRLNKSGRHEYADYLDMSGPTDDVGQLMSRIAIKYNLVTETMMDRRRVKRPQLSLCASKFVDLWRKRHFGCQMLDEEIFRYYLPKEEARQDVSQN